jgi:uncharacterized repeat protein (TIGR01451 family)
MDAAGTGLISILSGRKNMKRFLLGVTVLSSVIGAGAVAAFYGHDYLAQQPAPAAAPPVGPARDLTPQPLALAEEAPALAVHEPASSNPFAREAVEVQRVSNEEPVAEVDDTFEQTANQLAADTAADDIPPAGAAAGAATAASDPFAPRALPAEATQNAEQMAGSEGPLEADVVPTAAAEPRELEAVAPRPAVDRYGRPLPAEETAPDEPASVEFAGQQEATTAAEPQPFEAQAPAAFGAAEDNNAQPAAQPASEGTGRPGDPKLSGAQAPMLTIEKTAPPEIQIGKAAKFQIKVRNTGSADAHGVEVHDTIPQGTQFVGSQPPTSPGPNGELLWSLGTLKPGAEQNVELELMPTDEGEIGSVATVHFRAEASVRTIATKPMLDIHVEGPQSVMKGDQVLLKIRISNPGSGAVTGVTLSETVPQGLTHPAGGELEFDVGTLKPGEERALELSLVAAEAGMISNVLAATGDANLRAEATTEFEIIAPQLEVSLAGPKRRYLERNATHNISVANPGTASAKDIELVAVLPRELQFVSANNNGQFDPATHSVYWSLEELPAQETGTVTLTTLPLQPGDAKLVIKSRAQQNLADESEEVLSIEGLAALNFQLSDASDPIEVNGQNTYEVKVTNQGTKAASNVQLVALLPPEMKGVSAEGPVRYRNEGQRITFEPLKQLGAKAEAIYKVTTQAIQPGDLRLQVQITTDEIREPITKEESTRVFGNE